MKITNILGCAFSLLIIGCSRQETETAQPQPRRARQTPPPSQQSLTNPPSAPAVPPTQVAGNHETKPIDLTKYYTTPASYFDQIENYPWRDVPRGAQTFGHVPLDIGGMICLWGGSNAKRGAVFPEQVTGIAVTRKFDALYLYHAAFSSSPDGTPVAELVFRYDDGTSFTNAICYGTHVRDWYEKKGEPEWLTDSKSKVVWRGVNSTSRSVPPSMLRFFITEIANPKPLVVVTTIDLFSLKTKTAPCMLAMTTGPAQLLRVEP